MNTECNGGTAVETIDYFGGCPTCKKNDGYLNVGRAHWFICHAHRVRWCGGENLFSTWREEDAQDWDANWAWIGDYAEVKPLYEVEPEPAGAATPGVTAPERSEPPRIYVASLADYNAGRLHGRWVDADQPAHVVREQIAEMLRESSEPVAEEWAIHDYEHFGPLRLSEFEDIDRVAEVAFLITQYGDVFAALVDHVGGTARVDEARRYMQEGYRGAFESLADYVQESVEDCFAAELKRLPEFIRYHIDWDGIAHDMELNGDVFTLAVGRHVHVFDANA